MKIIQDDVRNDFKYKYTIYDYSDEPNSGEVLWYLHGANNVHKKTKHTHPFDPTDNYEDTNFEVSTARNMQMVELMGEKKPRYIICPTFGDVWLLKEKSDKHNDPTTIVNFLIVMSQIEHAHGIVPASERMVMGHSQSGWAANVLALHPVSQKLFSKVLLVNPVFPLQPWHSGFPGDWAITDARNAIFLAEAALKEETNYQDWYPASYGLKKLKASPCKILAWASLDDYFGFYVTVNEIKQLCLAFDIDNFKAVFDFGTHYHFDPLVAATFLSPDKKPENLPSLI